MDPPKSAAAASATNKPRLSEAQKKQNHIISEQRRREAIRESYDRLSQIVPGIEGQGRSEAMVLSATVEYMKLQIKRKEELRKLAAEKRMGNTEFEKVYEDLAKSFDEAGMTDSSSGGTGEREGGGNKK
ncbi:hypothetical protein KC342_g17706 [Hortaea werneckii]|nr:hypothetical protein KC342_g17706 [Hortaea werneckii]KAI7393451.1 hypothetical protein KC328_g6594 [Hortaea werneckii]